MQQRTRRVAHGGFTLLEAVVATVIVGMGVAVLMTSVASGTRVNGSGMELTQAVFLAQELREWTLRLPFSDPDAADKNNPPGPDGTSPQTFVDDLDDLMNVTYSPPRDGAGVAMTDRTGWSETITLTWREADNLTATVTPGASDMIYVQVQIFLRGQSILKTGWLVARRSP